MKIIVLMTALLLSPSLRAVAVLDVSSSQFNFGIAPGGSPPPQTFRIFNRGDGALNPVAVVPSAYPWLAVSLANGAGTISISSSTLAAGVYNATFTLSDPVAADSPRTISVTLYVTTQLVTVPAALSISVAPGVSTFRDIYLPLQSVPTGNVPAVQSTTASGGNWLSTQNLFESGIYVRALIAPVATAGSYTGAVQFVYHGQIVGQVPINLTVTASAVPTDVRRKVDAAKALATAKDQATTTGPPTLSFGGAVDAANYCLRENCYLAPGSLVTLFGAQLANQTASATTTPLPTQLATTQVLVNGSPVELLYVSAGQVNFRMPATPPSISRWTIAVLRDGLTSNLISARYTSTAPAIFTADQSGQGYGAILLAGKGIVADNNHPATRGDSVEIYATGLGVTTSATPTVIFSGAGILGNVEVIPSYAGVAPGFVGLYQINVQIPSVVPATSHLRLQIRTTYNLLSNVVEMAVQ